MSAGADRLPRVLFVGRARLRFPLEPGLGRRYDALSRELEWMQLGTAVGGTPTDARFVLARPFPVGRLEGLAYHLALPFRVRRALRRFRPEVVIAQGAQESALVLLGRSLARTRTKVVVDLHGDWRAPTRLYGSSLRRLLDPFADWLARLALRRADAVRTITPYTSGLVRAEGVEPAAEFPAYMDFAAFTEYPPVPLPPEPRAVFVGVLERYKAFDVLAEAWRSVVAEVPAATLHVAGSGRLEPMARELVAELPDNVVWDRVLSAPDVARAIDAAWALVLPSRSEGMGRVVIEAGLRGRPLVGSRVGGIPDVAVDGETALLVEPGDAAALAEALIRVLTDDDLPRRLGEIAHISAQEWLVSPEEYARRLRDLVDGLTA